MYVYGYRDRNGRIRHVTLSKWEAKLNAKLNGGTLIMTTSNHPNGAVGAHNIWIEV